MGLLTLVWKKRQGRAAGSSIRGVWQEHASTACFVETQTKREGTSSSNSVDVLRNKGQTLCSQLLLPACPLCHVATAPWQLPTAQARRPQSPCWFGVLDLSDAAFPKGRLLSTKNPSTVLPAQQAKLLAYHQNLTSPAMSLVSSDGYTKLLTNGTCSIEADCHDLIQAWAGRLEYVKLQ